MGVPLARMAERLGWWLMGLPTGIRRPWRFLLRFGPYRWGARLIDETLEMQQD